MRSKKNKRIPPMDRTQDKTLAEVEWEGTIYKRTVSYAGDHEIIISHKTGPQASNWPQAHSPFYHLAFGDPKLGAEAGAVYEIPGDIWSEAGAHGSPYFNCLAYALGERVGLTPNDWLEGIKGPITNWTNPAKMLLSLYFSKIKALDASKADLLALTYDRSLHHEDICCLEGRIKVFGHIIYHAGRIWRLTDQNYLVTKMGEARLIATPLSYFRVLGPRTYGVADDEIVGATEVKFYRFKS